MKIDILNQQLHNTVNHVIFTCKKFLWAG